MTRLKRDYHCWFPQTTNCSENRLKRRHASSDHTLLVFHCSTLYSMTTIEYDDPTLIISIWTLWKQNEEWLYWIYHNCKISDKPTLNFLRGWRVLLTFNLTFSLMSIYFKVWWALWMHSTDCFNGQFKTIQGGIYALSCSIILDEWFVIPFEICRLELQTHYYIISIRNLSTHEGKP